MIAVNLTLSLLACDGRFRNASVPTQAQSELTHIGPRILFLSQALEHPMKALLLYVVFVLIGASIAVGIGYWVEINFSAAASLVVFLILFFVNFGASWIGVIYVMDGSLEDAQGRQAQRDIEKSGQAEVRAREGAAANIRAGRPAV
jgi:hypothetical protein